MPSSDFDSWFADYLSQSQDEIKRLLRDKAAVRFLIAWSLLETSCFHGFAKGRELKRHCRRIVEKEGFSPQPLMPIVKHFHDRYQDNKRYLNLMHGNRHPDMKPLLDRPVDSLSDVEQVHFAVSVVYRYRNNIFHGSKGVTSWLAYKPQINRCTQVMQALISHTAQV